jgi:chromosome segregation ATPase
MMNQNQIKQLITNQTSKLKILEHELADAKLKHESQMIDNNAAFEGKIKEFEENIGFYQSQLSLKITQLELANQRISELETDRVRDAAEKSRELELANQRISELETDRVRDAAEKSRELELANQRISQMTQDLDKRNDAICNIDKIILRNNDYFDEVKNELNNKIASGKEMNELYEKTNEELCKVRREMELLHNELSETKKELQLYKNDFILKSATF